MRSRSVLVVDDDPVILATVAEILASAGYATRTAQNGIEALLHYERDHPALVLLDLRMPVFDGWGFARVLAQSRAELKLIVMSGAHDGKQAAAQLGADGYLAKPFDLDQLLAEVTRLCAA